MYRAHTLVSSGESFVAVCFGVSVFAEVPRPLLCFRALVALTCWLVSDLRLLDRRFDTNHDGVLSFEEFCLVADAAIDGDRRLPPPTLTLYPPPAAKGPTVTPPEVSAQLRALLARSPAPVRLTTEPVQSLRSVG